MTIVLSDFQRRHLDAVVKLFEGSAEVSVAIALEIKTGDHRVAAGPFYKLVVGQSAGEVL